MSKLKYSINITNYIFIEKENLFEIILLGLTRFIINLIIIIEVTGVQVFIFHQKWSTRGRSDVKGQ